MPPKLIYGSLTLLLFVSLALTFELPARAYADPGSALLLLQSLGAVASGVLFYFRRRIKRLFTRNRGAKPGAGTEGMSHTDS